MISLYWRLGKAILFALCRTCRFREINAQPARDLVPDKSRSAIFVFWHNRMFFMTYFMKIRYVARGHKLLVFSSYSKDGEIMTRLESSLGTSVIRGSTSKGAIKGLINLLRKALTGYSPVITPDGPRGPKYEVQDGLLFLAQKTGFPIIPVSWSANRFHRFKSWDSFMIPMPFARVNVTYGQPVIAQVGEDKETLRQRIKDALMEITVD
ncbi:MAG TPA: lysophospholipid acyltransferase family protein [Planctomycetota bacterium]|nr:lysophospholipid acyltransferase family protein [Planctomycetota bacterium]